MESNSQKVNAVFYITFAVMIIELIFGYMSKSMALTADGWHMATHTFALGLSAIAYALVKKNHNNKRFKSGTNKILHLSGYSSALILAGIAILIAVASVKKIITPEIIDFNAAIPVAIFGCIVNLVCAIILHQPHNHHEHSHKPHNHDHNHSHDLNIKAAYIHVLSDMLTSIFAIAGLFCAKYFSFNRLDPILGIVGSVIIMKWSWDIARAAALELLDYK